MSFLKSIRQFVTKVTREMPLLGKPVFETSSKYEISSDNDRSINSGAKTYIVIHGFMSDATQTWVKKIQTGLAKKDPSANVLAFDWSSPNFATTHYRTEMERTKVAGEKLANYLKERGIDPKNVVIVGHSLGAHVGHFASKAAEKLTGEKVGTIYGLDPAGARGTISEDWELDGDMNFERGDGLNKDSATNVVAIHTNPNTLGLNRTAGTKDFYVTDRPRDTSSMTDHAHAHEVLINLLDGKGYKQANGEIFNQASLDDPNTKGTVKIQTNAGIVESTPAHLESTPSWLAVSNEYAYDPLVPRAYASVGIGNSDALESASFGQTGLNAWDAFVPDPLKLEDCFVQTNVIKMNEQASPAIALGGYAEQLSSQFTQQIALGMSQPSVAGLDTNTLMKDGNFFNLASTNPGLSTAHEKFTLGV